MRPWASSHGGVAIAAGLRERLSHCCKAGVRACSGKPLGFYVRNYYASRLANARYMYYASRSAFACYYASRSAFACYYASCSAFVRDMSYASCPSFALTRSPLAIFSPAVSHGPRMPCRWPSAATRTGALSTANGSWSTTFSGLMRLVVAAICPKKPASVQLVRRSVAAQGLAAPCLALPTRPVVVAISAASFASAPVVRRSIAAQRLATAGPCMALPR